MDEHIWTMPARNSAEPAVDWRADRTGLWMGGELIGFPETSREILRLAEGVESADGLLRDAERIIDQSSRENALLRRERALLIELEKARTRILASIFDTGGGCSAEDVRQVGELLMSIEALHLEASGGVQRPEGVGCACVLCRPEGALQREEDASAAREVAGLIERAIVEHLPETKGRMPVAAWPNCPACGYPGHGETDPGKKYMGIYRPGEPCDKCGHTEPGGLQGGAGSTQRGEIAWSHRDDPENLGAVLPCGDPACRQPNCPTAQAHTGAPGKTRAIRDEDDHSSR